jgi:FkbM family methyltransferase
MTSRVSMNPFLRAFHRKKIPEVATPQGQLRQAVYLGGNRVLTTTVNGQRLFLDARDLSLTPEIVLNGCWEPGVTSALNSLVKQGMIVVEVGANVGYFTTLLGRLVGPSGLVCAFEANPAIFDLLIENIDINGLIPFVRAEWQLVCDTSGEREITLLERHRGSGSMLSFSDEFVAMYRDKKTTIAVPATTLDDFWRSEQRTIDLVKLDAEGSEPMIIDGMHRILGQSHLIVVCEFLKPFFDGSGRSAKAFLDAIVGYGFAVHKITEHGEIVPVSLPRLLETGEGAELMFRK